jgi:anti-sigma-K factor RskA
MTTAGEQRQGNGFGLLATAFGAVALVLAIVHFWAGPFEPQKTIERTVAETAVKIAREVRNVARNKPAITQPRTWNLDDLLKIAAVALAAAAIVAAVVGFVRREDHRPVIAGIGLGGGAIAFQFVTWVVLVIAGLVLLWIIISNLGGILGAGG